VLIYKYLLLDSAKDSLKTIKQRYLII